MKIRLILPICKIVKNKSKKYCYESQYHKERFQILQKSMQYNSKEIDLIVTSNNFFEYNHKITNLFLENKLNTLQNKKNLLIGVDFPKMKNPYNGIPAKVFYLSNKNNRYKIDKFIWEVWNPKAKKNKCTLNAFKKQNRVIEIANKSITMLSCGDILSSVHQSGKGLPNTDMYISLAHLDFSNYSINKQQHFSWLQHWLGKEKLVFLTQQLTKKKLNNKHFFKDSKYKLMYPENILENQEVYFFDNKHKRVKSNPDYIFIDLEI